MGKLTVKDLKEKLEDFEDHKFVGFIGPFSEFHPLSDTDVYYGSGHFDPSGRLKDWRKLVTDTPVRRVVHINCAQVRPPVDRIDDYEEGKSIREAVETGRDDCKKEVKEIYKSAKNPDDLADKIADFIKGED